MGDYSNPDYSLLGEDHVRRYRETDGDEGGEWNGAPALLLTATGRRSRELRTQPLIYARDGDDLIIVASMGGAPKHPQWYLNLTANPDAEVQVLADRFPVVARTANDDERARLWALVNSVWPNYDVYQTRTERVIPIVILSPTA